MTYGIAARGEAQYICAGHYALRGSAHCSLRGNVEREE